MANIFSRIERDRMLRCFAAFYRLKINVSKLCHAFVSEGDTSWTLSNDRTERENRRQLDRPADSSYATGDKVLPPLHQHRVFAGIRANLLESSSIFDPTMYRCIRLLQNIELNTSNPKLHCILLHSQERIHFTYENFIYRML